VAADLDVEVTDAPQAADLDRLLAGLIAFNDPFLGPHDQRNLAVLARLGGTLIGGLVGLTARGFLQIDLLWLSAEQRGHGFGSCLLAAAEAEAVRRGCRSAWLDTFDFQARPFYQRHGYRQFGELEGLPNGHRRYFMAKRLAPRRSGGAGGGDP
jgi:GNAT superfamily N-acetyltransferase